MTEMMSNTGILNVEIDSHNSASDYIPKQLQILGTDLVVKESHWVSHRSFNQDLQPGVYLIRINLSSGKTLEQIAEISVGNETNLEFNIGKFSPRETQEWFYLTSSSSGDNPIGSFRELENQRRYTRIQARRWKWNKSSWLSSPEPEIPQDQVIDEVGESFELRTHRSMELLELVIDGKPSLFVCLPPAPYLKCMIKIAQGPEAEVGALNVSIGTDNEVAEVLLSLVNSGDINKGKTLFGAEDAELLLMQKMADPVGAVIGSFFLLKTGELDRMHNWGNNLANWFPFFPDASIIHGWQLIRTSSSLEHLPKIRQRFLEAVNSGIPVYTEGLRLLYEGLMMLSFEFKQQDKAVEMAVKRISRYMAAADLSQQNTSFTGNYPDLPDGNSSPDETIRYVERITI